MKIQLPLENWADLLPFLPSKHLVALLLHFGDRHFASILQFCLNKLGIFIGCLRIVPPSEKDAMLKVWPGYEMGWSKQMMRMMLPDGPMPKNVKDFKSINLSYLDMSVFNFLEKFQQNSLLANVNLSISSLLYREHLLPFLANFLPLIDTINSINLSDFTQLGQINNGCADIDGYTHMMMKMLARTRILEISYNSLFVRRDQFDWHCEWLQNTPREDGKPRVLLISEYNGNGDVENSGFIGRIKEDFFSANRPVCFFIRLEIRANFWWHNNILMENGQTNERLVIKKARFNNRQKSLGLLISRHPIEASDKWIEENEKEIMDWEFLDQQKQIHLQERDRQIHQEECVKIGDFSSAILPMPPLECGTGRDPDGIHTGKRDRIIREFPYGIQPGHF